MHIVFTREVSAYFCDQACALTYRAVVAIFTNAMKKEDVIPLLQATGLYLDAPTLVPSLI